MHSIIRFVAFLFFLFCLNAVCGQRMCGEEPFVLNVTYEEKSITSPGWTSGRYPPNLYCVFNFNIPAGKYALVTFTNFSLEGDMNCENDYVELTLNGMGARSVRYCGDSVPAPMYMYSEYAPQMLFRTNNVTTGSGYRFKFRLTDNDVYCPELTCANMKCLTNSTKCNGIDDCGDGTDEENCTVKYENFDCGNPRVKPVTQMRGVGIVGGHRASLGSAPWQVTIQNRDILPSGHLCGGVLINKRWVLTAGHCSSKYNIRIKVGNYNQLKRNIGQQIRYGVKTIVHPDFNPIILKNDLALIKLNAPIIVNRDVIPICMPTEVYTPPDGTMCIATGWGRNSTTDTKGLPLLNQVEVPIFNLEECKTIHQQERHTVTNTNVCTGYKEGGINPCYGDSGGPLIMEQNGYWTLVGIVSFGAEVCGNPEPTVYTDVSKYLDWIKATTRANN